MNGTALAPLAPSPRQSRFTRRPMPQHGHALEAQPGSGPAPSDAGTPLAKKGRQRSAAQVLGGTRREAKRLLSPSRPQNGRRLFPAVFTQKGKWLRDRFFGTEAVKSVHGVERSCVSRLALAVLSQWERVMPTA